MRDIVLIDGKMLAYRAHYSHLKLQNKAGDPTGMLHGFFWELLRINKKLPQARMVICWDGDGKTWRHRLYPQYKAQRPLNPEWKRMRQQIEVLLPMLRKLGFRVYQFDGVEADDLIGILSAQLNDAMVRIYSADHDMYQLAQDGVYIWPKFDQAVIRMKDVERRIGAPLSALVEIKAMAGDPSDNLKGLPGVGMKTALKLWKLGLRISDVSNKKLWAKYSSHWLRVKKEYKLAQIICSEYDEVWDDEQRTQLATMVQDVDHYPGRNQKVGLMYKQEFYEFLGWYELRELFDKRHVILSLP